MADILNQRYGRVFLLITQVETIFHHDLNEAESVIQKHLENYGVPASNILFVQRECTWDESDISEHESAIYDAFEETKKYRGPYTDYLFCSTVLSLKKCIKENCKHQFTEKSAKNLYFLLDNVTKIQLVE